MGNTVTCLESRFVASYGVTNRIDDTRGALPGKKDRKMIGGS